MPQYITAGVGGFHKQLRQKEVSLTSELWQPQAISSRAWLQCKQRCQIKQCLKDAPTDLSMNAFCQSQPVHSEHPIIQSIFQGCSKVYASWQLSTFAPRAGVQPNNGKNNGLSFVFDSFGPWRAGGGGSHLLRSPPPSPRSS